jgi:membrane protein required for colicin V production
MNWFDLIVIILVLVSLGKGAFSGLVMQVASLAGLVLGAIFAGQLSALVAPELIRLTDASPHIIGPLSYIVAFIAILVGLFFAGKLVESFVEALQMNFLNRLAGAVFCCAKWVVLFSILLNLLVELDQNKVLIKEDVREKSYTYPYITKISQTVIPYLRFDWVKEI